MAYLGIRNAEDVKDNGLFYFDVLSVRNEIAEHFKNPCYYTNNEKSIALKEFGIEEKDIQDGVVLIHKYRKKDAQNKENITWYLGIKGTPFDGVYEFEKKHICHKMMKQFENSKMSLDLEEMLKLYDIEEKDIQDGGYLLGRDVTVYLMNKKKAPNFDKAKQVNMSGQSLLESMMSELLEDNDVIEIYMNEGTVYRFAVRDIFLVSEDVNLTIDNVEDLIKKNDIIKIPHSDIRYCNGYVVLYNCDDLGSPTIKSDGDKYSIHHYFDKVVINESAVSHLVGVDTYKEITIPYEKITNDKHSDIYAYLIKEN